MFIELVEWLRCVNEHEKTWLVATADRVEERDIVQGVLGCPVCKAEYPISDGIADFSAAREGGAVPPARENADSTGATMYGRGSAYGCGAANEAEGAFRLAALLNLDEPGGFVVLCGRWSSLARSLVGLRRGVHVLLFNPATTELSGAGVSIAKAGNEIPLRVGSCRGIAVDSSHQHCSRSWLDSAVAALRPGGRLAVPAQIAIPQGTLTLAIDDQLWVGARAETAALTSISRRQRT
ncbi:MAG: hypothetical protein ABR543_17990 [Gemmatimonadaceae bacterium]